MVLYTLGQAVKGQLSTYVLSKEIYSSVWLAVSSEGKTVVVKGVKHSRIHRERDILRKFQSQAPVRPLLDEIVEPIEPPGIVLQHLDDDLLKASAKKKLSRPEIKEVAKTVLEVLCVLHGDGYVHTDIKPDNILFNYKCDYETDQTKSRFADIRLADFGSCVSIHSEHAQKGEFIGAPIFRSPEATLEMPWGTATDIWSFGATLLSLFFGDYHIFAPKVPFGHKLHQREVLERMHIFFGPFPLGYQTLANTKTLDYLADIMEGVPQSARKPFKYSKDKEFEPEDRAFLVKIMKLDPRERPTAEQLINDQWFL